MHRPPPRYLRTPLIPPRSHLAAIPPRLLTDHQHAVRAGRHLASRVRERRGGLLGLPKAPVVAAAVIVAGLFAKTPNA